MIIIIYEKIKKKKLLTCVLIVMLHRISRLNASASADYKRLRKAYKMNTKSERRQEWTDQTPSDG